MQIQMKAILQNKFADLWQESEEISANPLCKLAESWH